MKVDLSRVTFDPSKRFLRVLMQQGRVLLDADWNEQTAILLHETQRLTEAVIGPFGGPKDMEFEDEQQTWILKKQCGFELLDATDGPGILDRILELTSDERRRLRNLLGESETRFLIGRGSYFVDGIRVENEGYVPLSQQPDWHWPHNLQDDARYLVYLDVWELAMTHLQEPELREVALEGPDTAARSKVVWQVKVESDFSNPLDSSGADLEDTCDAIQRFWLFWKEKWQPTYRGLMGARAKPAAEDQDPCNIDPEARFRGPENQLYRVEIHRSGRAANAAANRPATFKWSRDNGTVVFPIHLLSGNIVVVEHLGRDARRSLKVGDWVEIMDDDLARKPYADRVPAREDFPLLQVERIDPVEKMVTLNVPEGLDLPDYQERDPRHPILRRWESGELEVLEGANDEGWLDLEDGVQVRFNPAPTNGIPTSGNFYRAGDFWLVPARTLTGNVEWPIDPETEEPKALPPLGVEHHFAPLGIISVGSDGAVTVVNDCRCCFEQLCPVELTPLEATLGRQVFSQATETRTKKTAATKGKSKSRSKD